MNIKLFLPDLTMPSYPLLPNAGPSQVSRSVNFLQLKQITFVSLLQVTLKLLYQCVVFTVEHKLLQGDL